MKELIFKNEHDEPVNLEYFLHRENNVSKKLITRLKRQNMGITCDGKLIRTIDEVPPGKTVVLHIESENSLEPNPELFVKRVFENDSFVVFDKPQQMPVHPSINHYYDTLGNYFAYLYPDTAFRPVNRLDRNTSGLCVVAKNQHEAYRLQKSITKTYYAIICGKPEDPCGKIDLPIAREHESMIKRCVSESGQKAVTNYEVISSCEKYSYVKILLETGRTHQIRVHFSHIGYPLAGDDLYGGNCEDIQCQALHCGELYITDKSGKSLHLCAKPNENMKYILEKYKMNDCNLL